MSETHYDDPHQFVSDTSPGEILKRERERQGLSRDEVSTALNLRPAVVGGLEADTYDGVSVAAYRRGYLRAYARLLGIDDRPVIEAYNTRFGKTESEHRVTPVHASKPPSRLGAWLFKLVTLLVIAGLIGLTLLWWQSRDGNDLLGLGGNDQVAVDNMDGTPVSQESDGTTDLPPVPDEGEEMGLVDDSVESPDYAPPTATDSNIGDVPAAQDTPQGTPGEADEPTAVEASSAVAQDPLIEDGVVLEGSESDAENQPTETQQAEAATGQDAATPETAAQEEPATASTRSLSLTFNEQSWTEIFDANNNRIFVGLQEAGSQATAEGQPPFRLTIGNASGVELRYRGEPVDLSARAGGNNVARFTLGE
ncbi:RodZ domain-containing protein [Litchfieldella xinjiangensis]|uniref:RodZ domain-containing protein n=1 Tax=Litchfieldella xinjiangensis TaxID=1166948 RepID=UPI0005BB91BB|nr:RodZ domain-containing protein [Halomonas xinjiangensis]